MGLSWPDWVLVLLLALFALGGLLQGAVAQTFAALGVIVGLWAAMYTSGWVDTHWIGARPALVFVVLRWLVSAVVGFVVAAALQWAGNRLGGAMRDGPLGWLDRSGGLVVGASVGVIVCAFVLLAALTLRIPGSPGRAFANARVTAPTLDAAVRISSRGEGVLPGGAWMKRRFLAAQHRVMLLREGASKPRST